MPFKTPDQLKNYPITPLIREFFDKCTQKSDMGNGCKMQDLGIMGDAAHQARKSCHNVGEAMDIGDIQCAGQTIKKTDPKYCKFVACFADDTDGKTTDIHKKQCGSNKIKSDHAHVHIEKKPCRMVTGAGAKKADNENSIVHDITLIVASIFGIQPANAAAVEIKDFEKNFDKKIEAPAVGKVRIKYNYAGEPMLSPAQATLFVTCQGAKKELEVTDQEICSINKYEYNAPEKTFYLDVQKGRVDETSQVYCDQREELSFNVGDFCKEAARKAAGQDSVKN